MTDDATELLYLTKRSLGEKGKIKWILANFHVDGYVRHRSVGSWGFDFYKLGRDVHRTPEEALIAFEAARSKKIASLKAQIDKPEKLTPEFVDA